MSDDFSALRWLVSAGDLFVASVLLLASALVASRFIRQAGTRHFVWTTAFGALLALPILAAIMPASIRILLPAPPPEIPAAPIRMSHAIAEIASQAAVANSPPLTLQMIALGFGGLWLAGGCAVLLHGLIGALRLHMLRRRSSVFALPPDDLPRVSASRRECELRLSHSHHGPMTWGLFRPVILLPRNSLFWPRERRHAVLLHELAHIRRRDSLVHVLSLFVSALYWPNPLIWVGGRAMRREAEIAADDAVIASGMRPSAYAKELLQLASEFRVRLGFSGTQFSMAAPSALESRLKSVLARNPVRSGVTKMDVLKILGVGLLATAALVFTRPSVAEDVPQARATVSQPSQPDAPPAPAVPPTPSFPAAPPTPAVPDAPPEPPLPPAPGLEATEATPPLDLHIYHHKLTPAERAYIRAVTRKAQREAEAAIAKAQPEIDRTMAKVQPEIDRAMAKVQPEIDRAMAEIAKSQPDMDHVMREIERARPHIRQAMELARTDLAKAHLDAKIRSRVDAELRRAQARLQAEDAREHDKELGAPDQDSEMPEGPDAH